MNTASVADIEVGRLARRTRTIPGTMVCGEVERIFARDPSLGSLIVRPEEGLPLLVDRVSFLNAMLGEIGFGRPLYEHRPVTTLTDPSATYIVPAHYPATDAFDGLLTRPAAHRFRDIVVEYPGGGWGTLAAALLIEHVARAKAVEALQDPLTGLANRTCILDSISRELMLAERNGPVSLLFIDLDRFKVVNDALGHGAGDQLLIVIANRIRACVDAGDLVARLGGDEFAVLLDSSYGGSRQAVASYAERIGRALTEPVQIAGQEVFVSASIGIAIAAEGESPSTLVRRGDIAMYQAKRRGGGYYFFEESDDGAASRRLDIEAWLRHAISDGTLGIHYQPIVTVPGGALRGFEALVRGHHPVIGTLGPNEFLPLAEEIGVLPALDRHVLRGALQAAAVWRAMTADPLFVSVNVSAASLRDDTLLTTVPEMLAEYDVPPSMLTLEVTESAMLDHPKQAADVLHALQTIGVRIAVDDFGTGHSSLTQLTTFHADVLKIDRSFVSRLCDSERDQEVVALVLALARAMQASVVAEGIEKPEQAAILARMGCGTGQGYLFGKPSPAENAIETIRKAAAVSPWVRPATPHAA